jgi:hypothetical protein
LATIIPAVAPMVNDLITFQLMFFFWTYAPIDDENGIENIFVAKAPIKDIPAKESRGILIDPPPIPNKPLIKPVNNPIPAKISI